MWRERNTRESDIIKTIIKKSWGSDTNISPALQGDSLPAHLPGNPGDYKEG